MYSFLCDEKYVLFSVFYFLKRIMLIYNLIFQLAELHVYLLPNHAWEKSRGLAEKDVVEGCISLGFVRWGSIFWDTYVQHLTISKCKTRRPWNMPFLLHIVRTLEWCQCDSYFLEYHAWNEKEILLTSNWRNLLDMLVNCMTMICKNLFWKRNTSLHVSTHENSSCT